MIDKKDTLRRTKDKASKAFVEGRWKDALKAFTEVVEGDPSEIGCFMKIGDIHRRLGNSAQAVAAYEPVVRHYAADGLLLKAVAVCKLILTVDSKHTATQEMLADLCVKRSGPASGSRASEPAPARAPSTARAELTITATGDVMVIDRGHAESSTHSKTGPAPDGQGVPIIRGTAVAGAPPGVPAQVIRGQPLPDAPSAPSPPSPSWPPVQPSMTGVGTWPPPPPGASAEAAAPPPSIASAWPQTNTGNMAAVAPPPSIASAWPQANTGNMAAVAPPPSIASAWPQTSTGNMAAVAPPPSIASAWPQTSTGSMGAVAPPPPVEAEAPVPIAAAEAQAPQPVESLGALDEIEVSEDDEPIDDEPFELNQVRKDDDGRDALDMVGVAQIPLFSDLPRSAFIDILVQMQMRDMKPGEAVIREGEIGDSFFVIVTGKVRIARRTEDGGEQVLAYLTDGAFFGEMAVLQETARTASVIVEEDSQIFEIKKDLLDGLIKTYPSVDRVLRNFYMQRLLSTTMSTHPLFRPFGAEERRNLMQKFRSRTFPSGAVLVEEGTRGEGLYILLTGTLQVTKHGESGPMVIAQLTTGDLFGEMSLLMNRPAMATVSVLKDSLVLRLGKQDFDELIMTHPQMLELVARVSQEREMANFTVLRELPLQEPEGAALV